MRALSILVLLTATVLVFVTRTTVTLPDLIATHYVGNGSANGFMTRAEYRHFMTMLVVGLPALIALVLGWLPYRFPQMLNLPHRDYWLAAERKAQTLMFLRDHAYRLGSLLVLFMAMIHLLILQANSAKPATLSGGLLAIVVMVFFAGLALWVGALLLHFRKPPDSPFDVPL